MSFYNEEEDELNRAIEASLQDIRNQGLSSSSITSSTSSTNETNSENNLDFSRDIETITDDEDDDEDDDDDELDLAVEQQQLSREPSVNNDVNNDDNELTIALQASLIDYHKTEEQLLNEIQEKSLQTIEDDKQRKLQREKEEDEIMAKIVQESYESNIALQNQSNHIINNVIDYENDEEQYMIMILKQIKEEEECKECKEPKNHSQLLIQEQDLDYEEALKQDIAKEQQKKSKSVSVSVSVSVSETSEKPLTKEEIRKARLSFYEKK